MTQPCLRGRHRGSLAAILKVNQKVMSQFQWQQIGSMQLDPEATRSRKSPSSTRQR
jgi:hypothetical protein